MGTATACTDLSTDCLKFCRTNSVLHKAYKRESPHSPSMHAWVTQMLIAHETVFHVQDSQCPFRDTCYTMDEFYFDKKGSWRINSRAELRFLPGEHELSYTHPLKILGNQISLVLQPANIRLKPSLTTSASAVYSDSGNSTVSITCIQHSVYQTNQRGSFFFGSLSELSIHGIQLHSCAVSCEYISRVEMTQVIAHNVYFSANGDGTPQKIIFRDLKFVDSQLAIYFISAMLQNCTFISSQSGERQSSSSDDQSKYIRHIYGYNVGLAAENSTFSGATNSAVYLISSTFNISGMTAFSDNSGKQGGAVVLYSSQILLRGGEVSFINNHATSVGGAIFANNEMLESHMLYPRVSQTVEEKCHIVCLQHDGIHVSFINNTAVSGGSATYGVTLDETVCSSFCPVHHVQDMLTVEPDEPSVISSDPVRVCTCQKNTNTPDCSTTDQTFVSVFPGEIFSIRLAVVGLVYGTVKSTVVAKLQDSSSTLTLGTDLEEESYTIFGCTDVQYTVYSNNTEETLVAIPPVSGPSEMSGPKTVYARKMQSSEKLVYTLPPSAFQSALFVRIGIKECPKGFELSETSPVYCKCALILEQNSFSLDQCNISSQRITRRGTVWVSYSNESGVVAHTHCPFGYCRPEQTLVDLDYPDTQCTQNRSGVLCGGCENGSSVALGSSRCIQCTNTFTALLLVFMVAGVLLVFLIKALNLTVAMGTINGLIFYANIVGANQAIFFPDGHTLSKILTVFISWLNLDFGIETCFFDGLDSYSKTWLQFVFPLYIWLIATVIIVASRRSTRFTTLMGNNSVPVLATLLLLSYGKLLRTSIAVFSFAQVTYQDGSKDLVWAVDGNIQYLGQKHIALFIVTTAAVLGLWVPYTILLLSGQAIRKCTCHKRFHRVLNLQLFFEAYHGPFNNGHAHWVGTLLVARVVLYTVFASFFATETRVNLLSTTLLTVILMMYTPVFGFAYKKNWLTALECSFLLNLTLLSSGTLYIETTGSRGKEWLVGISVGVAFFQFLGILVYHSATITFRQTGRRVMSKLNARLRRRADFARLETRSEEALNELDIDVREADMESSAAVTETVIEPPREEHPLSQILGHYSDRHITGTVYST